MFLVAQAPASHLGMVPKQPLLFDRASCARLRPAAALVANRAIRVRNTILVWVSLSAIAAVTLHNTLMRLILMLSSLGAWALATMQQQLLLLQVTDAHTGHNRTQQNVDAFHCSSLSKDTSTPVGARCFLLSDARGSAHYEIVNR